MRLLFLCVFSVSWLFGQYDPIDRNILVLYDSQGEQIEKGDPINATLYAEMPLNQLGLKLLFHDVAQGPPDWDALFGIRGILIWPNGAWVVKDPVSFLKALQDQVRAGVKLVIFGDLSFDTKNLDLRKAIDDERQKLFELLGVRTLFLSILRSYTYNIIYQDPVLTNFERSYAGLNPTYELLELIPGGGARAVVAVEDSKKPGKTYVWLAMHPKGAIGVPRSVLFQDPTGRRDVRRWFINPFTFFQEVFATDDLPKPDTTTLAGNRIFYSHVDGDGWYNVSLISPYNEEGKYASEVLYEEVYKAYPDLPVTVGPIAAEMNEDWVGKWDGIEVAKKTLSLPHVEVGNHTYSHPFYWQFFEHYTPKKEEPYLRYYAQGNWNDFSSFTLFGLTDSDLFKEQDDYPELPLGYKIPRAFANEPFNLELETWGSIDEINRLTQPFGKKVEVYQWSGNTSPYEQVLEKLEKRDMPNINGGDTRFDVSYPSFAFVAPIGKLVGSQRQIYSSNSNENTYTNLWRSNYFGFKDLPQTFRNTETPLRLKPMNVYYHSYSGERISSLEAVKQNLEYVRTQPMIAIPTSLYAKIGEGFYSTEIYPIEHDVYRIEERGALQTIRFDQASDKAVDFEQSMGVVGQKHLHGSLYVYLEDEVESPKIALKEVAITGDEPPAAQPYLIDASWRVSHFQLTEKGFSFEASGFGRGKVLFYVPKNGRFIIKYENIVKKINGVGHELSFTLPKRDNEPLFVEVIYE